MMAKNNFKFSFCFLVIFFFTHLSFGQLSNFTFNVSPTPETCLGNGVLTFSVSGTQPGSNMDYTIYQLPNTTTPLAVVTTSSLTGLNAGNYLVVATQSLGANSGTQQQNVVILNNIHTLTYTLVGTKVKCGNDGEIAVNVTTGTVASYQIISGPVTTPYQASNVFTGLPVGVYQIGVKDVCNEVVVQTFTLVQTPVSLIVDPGSVQSNQLPSCNTITVGNFFGVLTGYEIAFPLTFEYTVFPPGGGTPVVYTQVVTSGSQALQTIPFYNNQSYFYNLRVTDACGNIYIRNNNAVNKKFDYDYTVMKLNCTDLALKLAPIFYVAPYTINFLSFPVGFNPVTYNPAHPGPFSANFALYGGVGNSFPEGNYTVQITDSCGRTMTKTFVVATQNPNPTILFSDNGCGNVTINLNSTQLISVVVVSAPSGYGFPLPHDLSSNINAAGSQFFVSGLPIGTYTFQVTDSCGNVTLLTGEVPPYNPPVLLITQRPGCDLGYGGVYISEANVITTAILIAAPVAYSGSVPANLSSNINTSGLVFGSVPEGDYTFQFTNSCGAVRTDIVHVQGYQITSNNVTITENCGSFNLQLQHSSNGNFLETFWLQKYDTALGQWVQPLTGVSYPTGAILSSLYGIQLFNNTNNLNFAFVGHFRIMKAFKTLNNGQYVNCYREIYTFDFTGGPKIINVYAFLCTNNSNEVIVEATGIQPLTYSITTQNGLSFVVNNGTQNSFPGLLAATYNFQVQDVCGNIVNSLYDITTLAPLTISSTTFCNGQNGSLSVPLFSFLHYEWWQGSNTGAILSTSNVLNFTPFNVATNAGTYHVRITNPSSSTSCIDTVLDYVIPADVNPSAGIDGSNSYCGHPGQLNLFSLLSGTYSSNGTWQELTSSGALLGNTWNATAVPFGTYNFKYRVDGSCGFFDESFVTITINEIPETPVASVNPVICDAESITLFATTVSNATYQWSGPNGFTSTDQNPIITPASSLNNGTYSVKSLTNDCESGTSSVVVNVIPLPQFSLDASCIDNALTLTATPIQSSYDAATATYEWTNNHGFTSSVNPTIITGLPKGTYTLSVTNSEGCTTTNSIEVINTLCTIPKGVSANSDGSNDAFDLSGFDGTKKVKIYNRYGMVVYEQDNYVNQWKGQDYKGNILPSATYYYYVQFDTGEAKTGWVYLTTE